MSRLTIFVILLFSVSAGFAQNNPAAVAARKWRVQQEHAIIDGIFDATRDSQCRE